MYKLRNENIVCPVFFERLRCLAFFISSKHSSFYTKKIMHWTPLISTFDRRLTVIVWTLPIKIHWTHHQVRSPQQTASLRKHWYFHSKCCCSRRVSIPNFHSPRSIRESKKIVIRIFTLKVVYIWKTFRSLL